MKDLRMFKYPLFDTTARNFGAPVTIEAPPSTGLHHVGLQDSYITVWLLVDTSLPNLSRTFHLVGTGHSVSSKWHYLGTVSVSPLVWHVFEDFSS